MINFESYNQAWIEKFKSNKNETINPPVLEKMIYALSFVEQLVRENLNFIFKGGTSLILHFDDFNRFSIDVDIITTETNTKIEQVISKICKKGLFTSFSYKERKSNTGEIPKAHYQINYNSVLNNLSSFIFLDVLFEESSYPEIISLPINSKWLNASNPMIEVKVPTIESILGDKITAFAPNTTGILYGKGKELEIIKQLHDIGYLFDSIKNIEIVKESFVRTVKQEMKYRNLGENSAIVLNDIVDTSLMIAKRDSNKTEPNKSRFEEFKSGLLSFKSYTIKQKFRIEDAIITSAKSAYLASLFLTNQTESFVIVDTNKAIESLIENTEYNFLNKLKNTNKLAFSYWYLTLSILGRI